MVEEAIKLQAHAERVLLMTFAIGAKSCEIIQAHILFHMWSFAAKRYLDDNRWSRLAMCSRMASELGLHREGILGNEDLSREAEISMDTRLKLNVLRTRAFLLMAENR